MSRDSDWTQAKAPLMVRATATATNPDPGLLGPCWALLVAPGAEHDYEIGAAEAAPAAELLVARSDERSIALSAEMAKKRTTPIIQRVAFRLSPYIREFCKNSLRASVSNTVGESENKDSPGELYLHARPVYVSRVCRSRLANLYGNSPNSFYISALFLRNRFEPCLCRSVSIAIPAS